MKRDKYGRIRNVKKEDKVLFVVDRSMPYCDYLRRFEFVSLWENATELEIAVRYRSLESVDDLMEYAKELAILFRKYENRYCPIFIMTTDDMKNFKTVVTFPEVTD